MSSLNAAFLVERLEESVGQVMAARMELVKDRDRELYPELTVLLALQDALVAAQSSAKVLLAVRENGAPDSAITAQQAEIRRMQGERFAAMGGRR